MNEDRYAKRDDRDILQQVDHRVLHRAWDPFVVDCRSCPAGRSHCNRRISTTPLIRAMACPKWTPQSRIRPSPN